MNEREMLLSERVEARKKATWLAIEADAESRMARRQAVRLGAMLIACAGALAFGAWLMRSTPIQSMPPERTIADELRDTSVIGIVRSVETPGRIAFAEPVHPVRLIELSEDEVMEELADAGIGGSLIQIGDSVQIALSPPASADLLPSGSPEDGPGNPEQQNF